tara:strand:- start:4615 stop:6324 length:1710 start_codon:yes stop_codon:yes gene_type:complete
MSYYLEDSVTNIDILTNIGFKTLVEGKTTEQQKLGISYLERTLAKNATPRPYSINEPKGKLLAAWIGRWYHQQKNFKKAKQFIDLSASSRLIGDDVLIQRATLRYALAAHANTSEEASVFLRECRNLIQNLLTKNLDLRNVIHPDDDDYVYCLLSSFYLETLYEEDWRRSAYDYYRLAVKAWPALKYMNVKNEQRGSILKIGIVSAFLYDGNSVIRDFGETLARLPKDKFALNLVYLNESNIPISSFCGKWESITDTIEIKKETLPLVEGVPKWLSYTRDKIVSMKLDIIFYPDLTMSTMTHRLAMSRLAPIQVTSHGHPVTSGIPTVDYYVSWEAAEIDAASQHYTEKLVLLPSNNIHQYYNPVFKEGISRITKQRVNDSSRKILFPTISGKRWYVCMQKPFKLHPCFGNMLQNVLEKDDEGIIILHGGAERDWGLDMSRVYYLNSLPHHELLALYREADVVLDSYYAGGCTTTREAFEMGAVVVTLPAKYLGGRWTKAYYDILGVSDAIAKDEDDYAKLAVSIACNPSLKASISSKISENIHKMWRSEEAVNNWTEVFLQLSQKNIS